MAGVGTTGIFVILLHQYWNLFGNQLWCEPKLSFAGRVDSSCGQSTHRLLIAMTQLPSTTTQSWGLPNAGPLRFFPIWHHIPACG